MMNRLIVGFFLLTGCSLPSPTPTLGTIAGGENRVVDLTHPLNPKNPYWPGENYKPFDFQVIAELERDGVYSGAFSMPEHLGTHIDAPNHFEAGQASVDQIALRELIAPLVVVDVRVVAADDADYQVSKQDLEGWEDEYGLIPAGAVVFAFTGWAQYWSDLERYHNRDATGRLHFPGFSRDAARFLVEERAIRGLGIDTLSVDYGLSSDFEVHHIVHGAAGYHVENAANLDQVPPSGAWMIAAPIKLENGSGGPARVWAVF